MLHRACLSGWLLLLSCTLLKAQPYGVFREANMNGKRAEHADFKCWSITPDGPFNYGVDRSLVDTHGMQVTFSELKEDDYPYDLAHVPVSVSLPVRKIQWEVCNGLNPFLPEADDVVALPETETIRLVPYGSTELRLTVFPNVSPSTEK